MRSNHSVFGNSIPVAAQWIMVAGLKSATIRATPSRSQRSTRTSLADAYLEWNLLSDRSRTRISKLGSFPESSRKLRPRVPEAPVSRIRCFTELFMANCYTKRCLFKSPLRGKSAPQAQTQRRLFRMKTDHEIENCCSEALKWQRKEKPLKDR